MKRKSNQLIESQVMSQVWVTNTQHQPHYLLNFENGVDEVDYVLNWRQFLCVNNLLVFFFLNEKCVNKCGGCSFILGLTSLVKGWRVSSKMSIFFLSLNHLWCSNISWIEVAILQQKKNGKFRNEWVIQFIQKKKTKQTSW